MAIEGLKSIPEGQQFPGFDDHVGAAVEALSMLGLVEDPDAVRESVATDFRALGPSGKTGEPYVWLPRSVTMGRLVTTLNGGNYPATYVYDNLWTPGTEPGSYTDAEMGCMQPGDDHAYKAHGRLAVYNATSASEPLLHFLGMPFDDKYAEKGEQTQLKAIAEAKRAYESEQPDFAMTALAAKGVAFIALTRRIKDQPMPLQWGFMRDGNLTRKAVGGDSVVGCVLSYGGRLELGGSSGVAGSAYGVGLSVGPKNLEL